MTMAGRSAQGRDRGRITASSGAGAASSCSPRLRPLAVTGEARSRGEPDVPTMAELGFAGYEFNTWVGVAVPKGTPREVVDRLRNGLVDTIASPEVKATLREQGAVPVGSTPEQFRRFVADEIAKSSRIVAEAEIQPD